MAAKKWPQYEYWLGEDGNWYWHKRVRNGNITEDGSEGYYSSYNVRRALRNKGVANEQLTRIYPD